MSLRLKLYDLSLDVSRFCSLFKNLSESKRLDFSLYSIMPFGTEFCNFFCKMNYKSQSFSSTLKGPHFSENAEKAAKRSHLKFFKKPAVCLQMTSLYTLALLSLFTDHFRLTRNVLWPIFPGSLDRYNAGFLRFGISEMHKPRLV